MRPTRTEGGQAEREGQHGGGAGLLQMTGGGAGGDSKPQRLGV